MFRDTLIESSSTGRKRKRWPMIVAVILEALVGAALIALPLLSTGVIPVSAHISIIAPLGRANATRPPVGHPNSTAAPLVRTLVLNRNVTCISRPTEANHSDSLDDRNDGPFTIGVTGGLPSALADPHSTTAVAAQEQLRKKILRVSEISEGQLLNKVEPVYPRMALISGVKGDVRLHAIIAKDGTIQSLTVDRGHPMLIEAARIAVSQWRYRPYLLNGEPVEVETFITVSFK